MRGLLLAAVAVVSGTASGASAADMPDLPFLRGGFTDGMSTARVDWQGVYFGGQGGIGESDMNFTGATQSIAAHLLADTTIDTSGGVSSWPVGGKVSVRGTGFGGFAGYNSQWDEVVLGLEFSYMHGNFGGGQSDSISRSFADSAGYTDSVTYTGTSSISVSDMATFRGRAGYAFGSFLPYMFGGVALGRADIVRSASVVGSQVNPNAVTGFQTIPVNLAAADGEYNHLVYGYSAGLGVDVMLKAGLFLRAEWEYIRFTSAVDTSINTVRLGLGYKF